MKKKIFGYQFDFELNNFCFQLRDELAFYPDINENEIIEKQVQVRFIEFSEKVFLTSNPSLFKLNDTGFSVNYPYAEIEWDLQELEHNKIFVFIKVKPNKKNVINNFGRKCLSIGYELFPDNVGQIIHELVFIPVTFFFQDKVLAHGSCLFNKKRNISVLFGGTGGVGKTSALLGLARDDEWVFLSDDIVVLNDKGIIYPNYAYPKVYAYNTIDNKALEKKVLNNSSLISKIQWYFKKARNSSKVRRRISPSLLYNTAYREQELNINLFLIRGNFQADIQLERIDSAKSAILEESIMIPEYGIFYNYLNWFTFNAVAMGLNPNICYRKVLNNNQAIYKSIFDKAENYLVKIDKNISHKLYKERLSEEIERLLGQE